MTGTSAPSSPFDTTSPERYRASRRVTHVSMATNALLAAGQVAIGLVGHSQALVADGFHTLSDLISDLMVLFALKHSSKEADEEHPYGHARIETAATVALGSLLILVGVGIAVRAGLRLWEHEAALTPSTLALWVAAFTIVAKEALYQYTVRTARRFGSDLLRANAWHHRSDAISSIIVFIGIAGSIYGITYMDALAAIGVALFVAKIGAELSWPAIAELVDTGLDREQLQRIRRAILTVDGVKALHLLRTRRLGGQALVDVHIIVSEHISVSEGHQISEAVRHKLIHEIDVVADVMVHIDPEDDLVRAPSDHLPLRSEIEARLHQHLRDIPGATELSRILIHYVDGHLHLELVLPMRVVTDGSAATALAREIRAALQRQDPDIAEVRVYFE